MCDAKMFQDECFVLFFFLSEIFKKCSPPLIFLSREREQELYGPKKRGPKPKTLLLKVGRCTMYSVIRFSLPVVKMSLIHLIFSSP